MMRLLGVIAIFALVAVCGLTISSMPATSDDMGMTTRPVFTSIGMSPLTLRVMNRSWELWSEAISCSPVGTCGWNLWTIGMPTA